MDDDFKIPDSDRTLFEGTKQGEAIVRDFSNNNKCSGIFSRLMPLPITI